MYTTYAHPFIFVHALVYAYSCNIFIIIADICAAHELLAAHQYNISYMILCRSVLGRRDKTAFRNNNVKCHAIDTECHIVAYKYDYFIIVVIISPPSPRPAYIDRHLTFTFRELHNISSIINIIVGILCACTRKIL